jgi:hypothetical protein
MPVRLVYEWRHLNRRGGESGRRGGRRKCRQILNMLRLREVNFRGRSKIGSALYVFGRMFESVETFIQHISKFVRSKSVWCQRQKQQKKISGSLTAGS